jgi:hypothetical protein
MRELHVSATLVRRLFVRAQYDPMGKQQAVTALAALAGMDVVPAGQAFVQYPLAASSTSYHPEPGMFGPER